MEQSNELEQFLIVLCLYLLYISYRQSRLTVENNNGSMVITYCHLSVPSIDLPHYQLPHYLLKPGLGNQSHNKSGQDRLGLFLVSWFDAAGAILISIHLRWYTFENNLQ